MEENKINVVIPKDYNGKPIEVILRQGKATELIPEKAPVLIRKSGAIDAPLRWLEKRIGMIDQNKSNICVSRRNMSIHLSIDEENFYGKNIIGLLELSDEIKNLKINCDFNNCDCKDEWDPILLYTFLYGRKRFFPNDEEYKRTIDSLMTIETKTEKTGKSTYGDFSGNNSYNIQNTVITIKSFRLIIPILLGFERREITVTIFPKFVDDDLRYLLMSEDIDKYINEVRDRLIDEQIEKIRGIAPDIAIIE